jgi:DNA-binding NarL/FixJ family response regulator
VDEERRIAGALSERQRRIIQLAAEGLTDREIGHELYLSESTVRFHMQSLKQRLHARSKTQLVAEAIWLGLIEPAPRHRRSAA